MTEFQKNFRKMCKNIPLLPSILPKQERIVAIGDLHGDFDNTIKLLQIAKVIEKSKKNKYGWRWSGGNTIVVQLGDQIDNLRNNPNYDEPSDIKILKFMTDLHNQAQKEKKGGAVYSLLGNHEIMNTKGDLRYVSKANIDNDGGKEKRKLLFKPGNKIANFLGCTRKMILKIGNNIFVHGGIIPQVALKYKGDEGIKKINQIVSEYLFGLKDSQNYKELLTDSTAPIWDRTLPYSDEAECTGNLKKIEQIYQVGRMIVGHTPQMNGIDIRCSNRLHLVDVGASRSFKNLNNLEVLEILNDNQVRILR